MNRVNHMLLVLHSAVRIATAVHLILPRDTIMTSAFDSLIYFVVHGGTDTRFFVSPIDNLTSADCLDLATRLVIVFVRWWLGPFGS